MTYQLRFGTHRIHHGPPALMAAILCVWWAATDWHDRKVWIRDLIREPR